MLDLGDGQNTNLQCVNLVSNPSGFPTRPGKPGKKRVYLKNLELSCNFVKLNKILEKLSETWKNWEGNKYS